MHTCDAVCNSLASFDQTGTRHPHPHQNRFFYLASVFCLSAPVNLEMCLKKLNSELNLFFPFSLSWKSYGGVRSTRVIVRSAMKSAIADTCDHWHSQWPCTLQCSATPDWSYILFLSSLSWESYDGVDRLAWSYDPRGKVRLLTLVTTDTVSGPALYSAVRRRFDKVGVSLFSEGDIFRFYKLFGFSLALSANINWGSRIDMHLLYRLSINSGSMHSK